MCFRLRLRLFAVCPCQSPDLDIAGDLGLVGQDESMIVCVLGFATFHYSVLLILHLGYGTMVGFSDCPYQAFQSNGKFAGDKGYSDLPSRTSCRALLRSPGAFLSSNTEAS